MVELTDKLLDLIYDAATDQVNLRNPWGSGESTDDRGTVLDGTDDGVFNLSLTDFDSIFRTVTYQD